jgi:MscS family membrane protein
MIHGKATHHHRRGIGCNVRAIMLILGLIGLLTFGAAAQTIDGAEGGTPTAAGSAAEAVQPSAGGATADESAQEPEAKGEQAAAATEEADGEGGKLLDEEQLASFFEELVSDELWQSNSYLAWLMLLGSIFVGLALGRISSMILRKLGERWEHRRWRVAASVTAGLASPLSLGLFTVGLAVGLAQLAMGDALREFTTTILKLLAYVAVFWYAYNLISLIDVLLYGLTRRTRSDLDNQLVPLIRKTLRIFLIVIAVLFIAQNVLGANIASWLAGLGIVGLAISLAAQDSLKHVFGSVTIFLDRPFAVGDFISYTGTLGTVEQIGFRSTRMRTLDGHLMTIPNASIANDVVTNVGKRPYIRRVLNITITYDTPYEKIQDAVNIVNDILKTDGIREAVHDPDEPDKPENLPPRVYFNDYNAASLNIVVYYWHRPPNWWEYLEHAQRFNLELFRRFGEAGIDFAFPTQTVYLADDADRRLAVRIESGSEQA